MNFAGNLLVNNHLAVLSDKAGQQVTQAIQNASARTGVSFAYLMEKASAESSFNPAAKAKTSSATGLYQFIDSTWVNTIKEHGEKYGINTQQSKSRLLSLRKDPQIAAFMAAEFTADNKDYLQQNVGGKIGNTELYFAHFMGARGGAAFLKARQNNPLAIGADIFPRAARANRNVFFDPKTGNPRTLEQIYQKFDKKFNTGGATETQNPLRVAHKNFGAVKAYEYGRTYTQRPIDHERTAAFRPHDDTYKVAENKSGGFLGFLQNLLRAPESQTHLTTRQVDTPKSFQDRYQTRITVPRSNTAHASTTSSFFDFLRSPLKIAGSFFNW